MDDIVLVGFGGHARSVADSIEIKKDYRIVGYVDYKIVDESMNYEYLGTDSDLQKIYDCGIRKAVVGVGQIKNSTIRRRIYDNLKTIGFEFPIIIDPTAIISPSTKLQEGVFVGKGAILNSNVNVGKMSIVNTGAICDHDTCIGAFSHLSVRAVCCGGVNIGNDSFIGANSTIIQNVNIGSNVVIGAGSTVLHFVSDNEKCFGIV